MYVRPSVRRLNACRPVQRNEELSGTKSRDKGDVIFDDVGTRKKEGERISGLLLSERLQLFAVKEVEGIIG